MESILGIERNLGILMGQGSLKAIQQLSHQSLSKTQNPVPGSGNSFASTLAEVQKAGDTKTGSPSEETEKLMEVAREFESLLVYQMLSAMRKTVHKSDLLNSFAGEQYESMLDEELSKEMVKQKSIGLAETIQPQLSRLANKAVN